MPDYSAGQAYLSLVPTLEGFSEKVRAQLADEDITAQVPVDPELDEAKAEKIRTQIEAALADIPPARVDAETTEAERKVQELRMELAELVEDKRIGVDVSVADAEAKVHEIQASLDELAKNADVHVDADIAAAAAKLAEIGAEADAVDKKHPTVDVEVDDKGSADSTNSKLGSLLGTVSKFGGMGALVAPLVAGVAGLGAAAAVGAAGLPALLLGFSGITGAIGAMDTADQQAGQNAQQAAAQQVTSANQVANAQDQVKSAVQGVADAQRQAADAEHQSAEQVASAERNLTDAQTAALNAQTALTNARQAATRSLEDMNNQVIDGALAQRQAVMDVGNAQQALNATLSNPSATQAQRDQAQLTYDQAKQHLSELQLQNQRLGQDQKTADAAGVEGSQQVVAAKQQVQQANQKVQDSQQALADAVNKQTEQQQQSAEQIAKAEQQVIQAERSLQDAMVSAGNTGTSSMNAVSQAMSKLAPAGQAFVVWLHGLEPILNNLKAVSEQGLLPGVQAGIQALLPVIPQITANLSIFASSFGHFATLIGQALASPATIQFFSTLANASTTILPQVAGVLSQVAGAIGQLVVALLPAAPIALQVVSALAGFVTVLGPSLGRTITILAQGLLSVAGALAPAFGPLGQILVALAPLVAQLATSLAGILTAAIQALLPIVAALAPPLTAIVSIVGNALIGVIVQCTPMLTQLAQIIGSILVTALNALTPLFPVMTQTLNLLLPVVQQVIGMIGSLLVQAIQAVAPLIPPIANAFLAVVRAVLPLVPPLIQIVEAIVPPLLGLLPTLAPLIVAIANAFGQVAPQLVPIVVMLAQDLIPLIQQLMPIVTLVFQGVVSIVTWALNTVVVPLLQNIVIPAIKILAGIFQWLWQNVVQPVFKGVCEVIQGAWDGVIKPVFDILKDGVSGVGKAFQDFLTGAGKVWDGLKTVVATPINFVINTILNDGLFAAWNWVVDHLGLPGGWKLHVNPIPGYASGGILPGYSPGRDNLLAASPVGPVALSGGEAIMRPEWTRVAGRAYVDAANQAAVRGGVGGAAKFVATNGLPGFFLGGVFNWVGNIASQAWNKVANIAGDIVDFAKDPIGALTTLLNKIITSSASDSNLANTLGQFILAVPKQAVTGLIDTIKSWFSSQPASTGAGAAQGGQIAGYVPSAGVAQWANQILHALTLLGQPASWLGTVERRMNQESGGNPTVVNKWDSNWAKGTPSVGLMQVIGPTFASNAGQFAGVGPFEYGVSVDPLSNIYAGLHHAIGTYGSLAGLNRPGGYDDGGLLPPGLSLAYNGTRRPEPVLTAGQFDSIASAASGGTFTGSLVLDSGEFLGVVRGEIASAHSATGTAIIHRTR